MLAKLWKKVLLAVCIVACLFNITSKLVNRHSLKDNLEKANDGVTVFDILKNDENSDIEAIKDVITKEDVTQEEITNSDNNEETEGQVEGQVKNQVEDQEIDENNTNKNSSFKFKDFTLNF